MTKNNSKPWPEWGNDGENWDSEEQYLDTLCDWLGQASDDEMEAYYEENL